MKFHQDLSYHSNEMMPYPILHKTEQLTTGDILEIRRQNLGLDIVVLTMAKFYKNLEERFQENFK